MYFPKFVGAAVFCAIIYACIPERSPIERLISMPLEILGVSTRASTLNFTWPFFFYALALATAVEACYYFGPNEVWQRLKDWLAKQQKELGGTPSDSTDSSTTAPASSSTPMSRSVRGM